MTTTHTTEQALEAHIEKALTGTCKEERGEGVVGEEGREPIYGPHAGYEAGLAANPCSHLRAGFDGPARCGLQ